VTVVGISPCAASILSFSLSEDEVAQTPRFLSLEDELLNKVLHFFPVLDLQENSFLLGLSHIVAVVAEFDEYSNDVLHLNEGSCLPRYNSPLPVLRPLESKRSHLFFSVVCKEF
jgi:hypothetical protein